MSVDNATLQLVSIFISAQLILSLTLLYCVHTYSINIIGTVGCSAATLVEIEVYEVGFGSKSKNNSYTSRMKKSRKQEIVSDRF